MIGIRHWILRLKRYLRKRKWYRRLRGGVWYYGGGDWEDPYWSRYKSENVLDKEDYR